MPKLSIIIVNYNVKHFLEQCLTSVLKSCTTLKSEVFVVDNNSFDGSCEMVKEKFSEVILIENKENVGFSVANNQAIKQANGEYILLLNPDTLVQEDTFTKVIDFMDNHPDAGGLGVKMIDGKGYFLPESKRGLPTPFAAFSKMFGLSKLFPKSKVFGKYHLSYLDKEKTHKVDVLSGAFMLLRSETLVKTGLLDENFFMYGEDIDLSYRITQAGYNNYYFPDTTIIHYKGESTKKSSINYVIVFYKAMIIFAKKHFSKQYAGLFSILINMAIYFRASIAIFTRIIKNIITPLHDAIIIYLSFIAITNLWEKIKFHTDNYYPLEYLYYILPTYTLLWIFSIFYFGGYEKPTKITNLIKGLIIGIIPILLVYALLPEDLRYSRAILLLGFSFSVLLVISSRIILSILFNNTFPINNKKNKRIIIIGDRHEYDRVKELIKEVLPNPEILGYIKTQNNNSTDETLGNISNLFEIVETTKAEEVVFCSADVPTQEVIDSMLKLSSLNLDYKIANPDSLAIVGSNSIHTSGELYLIDFNSINKPINLRNKRVIDITISLLFILLFPIFIFIPYNKNQFIINLFSVIIGRKTWVGFYPTKQQGLPKIKQGIIPPFSIKINKEKPKNDLIEKINISYAKDYRTTNDIMLIIKNIKFLGNHF